MKNTSIILLVLFVAVCSAARFPFQFRDSSVCHDCRGLTAALCYCSDLDNCDDEGCGDTGGCSRGICDPTPARKRMMQAFLKREPKPSDCADCDGFGPDCECEDANICRGMGCGVGECEANCPAKRKRMMHGYLLKRTCEDSDCEGLGDGCDCDTDISYCEGKGCDVGQECLDKCGKRKRMMKAFLKREPKPNDCADCAGFGAGCPCENLDICESEGCPSYGACTRGSCVA